MGPLERTDPVRVVRPGPAILVVQRIAQRSVERRPARRRDVQRLARRKLHARRHEMEFDPAAVRVRVPDPETIVLVRFEAGEGHALEFIHDLFLIGGAWVVFARKRDHATRIAPLPIDAVDQLARLIGIAAQDLGRLMFPAFGARHVIDRTGSITAAMREELDQHGPASSEGRLSG